MCAARGRAEGGSVLEGPLEGAVGELDHAMEDLVGESRQAAAGAGAPRGRV